MHKHYDRLQKKVYNIEGAVFHCNIDIEAVGFLRWKSDQLYILSPDLFFLIL